MYYIKITTDNDNETLQYYCRNCKQQEFISDYLVVTKNNLKQSTNTYHHLINEYTKYDYTLPRIMSDVSCDNSDCTSSTPRELICVRYDGLKYVYICSDCNKIITSLPEP